MSQKFGLSLLHNMFMLSNIWHSLSFLRNRCNYRENNGSGFAVSTSPGELLTQVAIEKNIGDLLTIFFMVNAVKLAASGMSNIQKLYYIETYASLTYLFGINCGLNIKCVTGITNGGNHTWNEIVIDGVLYWHDTTWDKTTNSESYFLTLPDMYDPTEQYIIHDLK